MYNRSILVGRLAADPELKQTPNGVYVCSFTIAVDRAYKGKDGQKEVDFLDCVAWRQTGEFVSRYFAKGKAILVEGSIQTRSYVDKNEQKRRVWEIIVDNARFVESKNTSQDSELSGCSADVLQPEAKCTPVGTDNFMDVDDDGDLPF